MGTVELMNTHERYQAHCLICNQKFEKDTAEEAGNAASDHEREKHPIIEVLVK